MVMSTFLAY